MRVPDAVRPVRTRLFGSYPNRVRRAGTKHPGAGIARTEFWIGLRSFTWNGLGGALAPPSEGNYPPFLLLR